MSIKNVLLGLGIGMICSGLVLAFYNKSGSQMSDAEIKKRAAELGMVEDNRNVILTSELEDENKNMDNEGENADIADDSEGEDQNLPEDGNNIPEKQEIEENDINSSKTSSEKEKEDEKEDEKTEDSEKEIIDTSEKNSSNTKTNSSKNKKTKKEEDSNTKTDNSSNIITIKITNGMTSEQICKKLEEKGLIKNAKKFQNYIAKRNMQRSLKAGTYKIDSKAGFDEILEIICKG